MFSLYMYEYGYESRWDNDNLGHIVHRYISLKKYLDPLAKCWITKNGELIAEVQ